MAKDAHTIKMQQVRIAILNNLNRLYPQPLMVKSLYRVLCGFDEHYSISLIQKDLTYLKQKGYVEYIDEKIGGMGEFANKFVGLTADGKEIADGTDTDSALEI